MLRPNRSIGRVCLIVLVAGCRDAVEPAAPNPGRPMADLTTAVNDPVFFYSTYLGGSGQDESGKCIAVDDAGNAYVTGSTSSADFPTTSGVLQSALRGQINAFVTKLNPTGSALVYSTYLGGDFYDVGLCVAVDAAGNAYVTGHTQSNNFPTTPGAFQTTSGGGDAFVTKLNAAGSGLVYSTYLGGSGFDLGFGIALDALGNAYVTGYTDGSFPVSSGAPQPTFGGGQNDAFVTKVNVAGSALIYSTYLGGSGYDLGFGIAVDAVANAHVTGFTDGSFPVTTGASQTTFGGGQGDAFVTTVNSLGTGLLYSTYLGGIDYDQGTGIAVDALGSAYVTGTTVSTDFPILSAFQAAYGGNGDGFVTKLNPMGSGLVYSTYLGGSDGDAGIGIALDALGGAYVAGVTESSNFPVTSGVPQATLGGGRDAFVTKLNPVGSGVVYSTYLGGSGDDYGYGIAVDALPNPNAYATGFTNATDFPTTPGGFQAAYGGGPSDAFVAKIANIVLPPGATSGKVTGGGTTNVSGSTANFGFFVQAQLSTGLVSGDLQYVNRASGAKVHSLAFTTLAIVGNTATFSGTCTNNRVPCTFAVDVTDNGEPGKTDRFTISVSGGMPEGGTLRSGNIQIHKTP